jgi:ADP-dependent NAD(P)H-hydrate dehydratase
MASPVPRPADLPLPAPRPDDAHKGTFGKAWIVAGSRGMSGAAILSGLGALRGGAGLVTVACPASIQSIVAGYEPSYLTRGLPEDDEGRLSYAAVDELKGVLPHQSAAAFGPGVGQSPGIVELASELYQHAPLPLVVDADGLNALAQRPEILVRQPHQAPRILTPHPGEFARLSGLAMSEIQSRRQETAADFARRHHVVVLLKGHQTVVSDGLQTFVNPTGNSGMATGGTGDVLTGLITALLAQRKLPIDAARLGAWLHGRAGDLAAEERSKPGLIASDLPGYLCRAWRELPM